MEAGMGVPLMCLYGAFSMMLKEEYLELISSPGISFILMVVFLLTLKSLLLFLVEIVIGIRAHM